MWIFIFVAFEFIAVAALSWYIIWYYARKNVEWYTKITIYIAWTLGFEIIILLPVDVYVSYIGNDPTEIKVMEYIWRFNYWIAFALCNFVFPMLGEYVIAGDFTFKAKLCTCIIQNFIFYSVLGLLGGIALLFLWAKGQFDEDNGSFSGFLIFCMNAYGLILIILFLGYGIVAVPKKYFGMKSFSFRKKFVYCKVARKEDIYQDKKYNLEELAITALSLYERIENPKLKSYANQIIKKCPETFMQRAKSVYSPDYSNEIYKSNLKSLVKLNKNMKKGIENYERSHWSLNESLREAVWLEDIENTDPSCFNSKVGGKFMKYKYYRYFIWYWEKYLKPVVSFLLFILCTLFSILIISGEVSIYLFESKKSMIRDLFVNNLNNFFLTLITIMIPLGYICFCTFYGIFHVRLFGLNQLHPNHHTDSFSLNFSATVLTRLAPPLCYNFILLAKLDGTTFEMFMGEMKWIPVLGVRFQQLFPILLIILAALNICDVWDKILKLIGLESYSFVSKFDRLKADEGEVFVKTQRIRVEKEFESNIQEIDYQNNSFTVKPFV